MADLRSELKRLKEQLDRPATRSGLEQKASHAVAPARRSQPVPTNNSGSGREVAVQPRKPVEVPRPVSPPPLVYRTTTPLPAKAAVVKAQQNTKSLPPSTRQLPVTDNVAVVSGVSKLPQFSGVDKTFRPLPKGSPTRQHLFKNPEPWVIRGGKTQISPSNASRALDVVIGLDFGTSYTKAAVGFLDKIFPVTWEGVSKCVPDYLLPSEYTVMEDGRLFIGQHDRANPKTIRGDLKLPFINPAVSSASIESASMFLALLLRYIRAWLYHHHAAKIANMKIRWQLNIGSPSNGLENKRLENAYRMLAATAWIRSQSENPEQVANCSTGLWQEAQLPNDLTDLQIRPEFVAQMAGYMQSPQRQKGLHALVDVGGGTLDVVTFIVHKVEDEDTFPFLVPEVHALGTHGMLQNRLVGSATQDQACRIDELQPIATPAEFATSVGVELEHVNRRDQIFQDEVQLRIRSVFEITRSRRYRLSDAWASGVRTFFTGGGSHVNLYLKAMQKVTTPGARKLQLMLLPPHPKLDGFVGDEGEYQRISVACGLAQDSFTLGRVVPAKEVEDDVSVVQIGKERPDRDDLYPK